MYFKRLWKVPLEFNHRLRVMKRSNFPYAALQNSLKHQPRCYTHVTGLIICNSKQFLSRQQYSCEMQTMSLRRDWCKPKFIALKVTRDLQSNTWEAIPQGHKGKVQSGTLVDSEPWQATERSEKLLETKCIFSWLLKYFVSTPDFSLLLWEEKTEPFIEHYQYCQDWMITTLNFLAS